MKKTRVIMIDPHSFIHGLAQGEGEIRFSLDREGNKPLDIPDDSQFAGVAMDAQSGFLAVHFTSESLDSVNYWSYPHVESVAVQIYKAGPDGWETIE